jgi:hypothetical protein
MIKRTKCVAKRDNPRETICATGAHGDDVKCSKFNDSTWTYLPWRFCTGTDSSSWIVVILLASAKSLIHGWFYYSFICSFLIWHGRKKIFKFDCKIFEIEL